MFDSFLQRGWRIGACGLAGLLAIAPRAFAHGGQPEPLQIVADPQDPQRLTLRATWGLARSEDAGATWHWLCEAVLGPNTLDRKAAWTDRWLVVTDHGIATSPDRGCSWAPAALPAGMDIVDIAGESTKPQHAWAIGRPAAGQPFTVVRTLDGGQSWQPHGSPLPDALHVLALVAAPSDPQRLYVSGWGHPTAVVWRSDDAGLTWLPLPLEVMLGQTVLAVDPGDADRLYVRSASANEQTLRLSEDAGNSWSSLWKVEGVIQAVALEPGGQAIVALVDAGQAQVAGLWRGTRQGQDFQRLSAHAGRCLTWSAAGLVICGDEAVDGYTLAISHDSGTSFTPLLHAASLTPLACAAPTTTASLCPSQWPSVAALLGADPTPTAADAGAGSSVVDAGSAPQPADAAGAAPLPTKARATGCAAGRAGGAGAAILAIALAYFVARFRRRDAAARP